jgi:hypothetical protein
VLIIDTPVLFATGVLAALVAYAPVLPVPPTDAPALLVPTADALVVEISAKINVSVVGASASSVPEALFTADPTAPLHISTCPPWKTHLVKSPPLAVGTLDPAIFVPAAPGCSACSE